MHRLLLLSTTGIAAASVALAQPSPNAGPTGGPMGGPLGGQVVAGAATVSQSPGRTTVTQSSPRAVVEWGSFSVGRDHAVGFVQPSPGAWTLNRVTGPDPSVIAGRITANGGVAIVNPSGVLFAQGARVDVGSLIATPSNVTNENFMAGRMTFDGAPRPGARIENRGAITVRDRGLVALAGPRVGNSGTIRANLGTVRLAGGAEGFALDLAGDGLLSLDVTRAVRGGPRDGGTALLTNSGVIEAAGGTVTLTAHAASGLVEDLVQNTGTIGGSRVRIAAEGGNVDLAAGRVAAPGGRVEVVANGGTVRVGASARVSASGPGAGQVQLGGGNTRRVELEGRVAARARAGGERGGTVALQATGAVTLGETARVNVSGPAGGGRVLVGTTGVGWNQYMAAETRVATGATIRADATVAGAGGTVLVNSAARTTMLGTISATGGPGGAAGNDGGFVEVSGQGAMTFPNPARIRLSAGLGGRPGTLLLDPDAIVVTEPGDPVTGDVAAGGAPAGTLVLSANALSGYEFNLVLEASNAISVLAPVAKIIGGDLTLRTTDPLGLGISLGAPVTLSAGQTLTLASAGAVAIGADLSASTLVVAAGGPVTQTAGGLNVGTLRVAAPSATLDAAGNTVGGLGASTVAGDLALATAGALAVTGPVSAGGLALRAGGAVTQSGSGAGITVGAGGLGLSAPSATLDGAGNAIAVLGQAGLAFAVPGLARIVNASGGLAIERPVSAGTLEITTPQSVTQSAPLAVGGATLRLNAGADVALRNSGNVIPALGASSAGGALRVFTTGPLRVIEGVTAGSLLRMESAGAMTLAAPTIAAGRAELVANAGGLALDGATFRIAEAALLASSGGMSAAARTSVVARTPGGVAPVLVLDTRAGGLVALPSFVGPETGQTDASQPTQLALFGAPLPAGAGMALNLSVEGAAFLLLGNGTAAGRLDAARIGVQGVAGGAALGGTLAGVSDGTAAARIVIAPPVGAAGSYTYNGCIIGVACRLLPPSVPPAGTAPRTGRFAGSAAELAPVPAFVASYGALLLDDAVRDREEKREVLPLTQPGVSPAPPRILVPRAPSRAPDNPDVLLPGIGAQDY